MAVDLKFPANTFVGRQVPKNSFYKHLEVNASIRKHFVEDVERITWTYKIAPSTINVADGKDVHEIVVFNVLLKQKECPDDVFVFIDKNLPRHVVFVLEYEGQYRLMLNYKQWRDQQKGIFSITKTFSGEWLQVADAKLPIDGLNMDSIYESMAGYISGYGTSNSHDTKRIVELEALMQKKKAQAEALQKQIRNQRQFNLQMELNDKAREIKKEIAVMQQELKNLKKQN